ncbi:MAG: glycosyltransferase [Actinobacteria bacterium]|nr:glycosyltransferase [Actinomycetota bacterium]
MSKIFILGMSPLPFENDRKVYGTGIRTWQFVLPLLKGGHSICLCSYAIPSAYPDNFSSKFYKNFVYKLSLDSSLDNAAGESKDSEIKDMIKVNKGKREINEKENEDIIKDRKIDTCNFSISEFCEDNSKRNKEKLNKNASKFFELNFEYNILKKDDFENLELLSNIFQEFKPDCVVGCTFYPSYIASRLLSYNSVPFWADLFGHVMAEAQARASVDGDDSCLFHYWNGEYNIITSADKFSCVSSRQEYALIGELGMVGRLNRYTQGYEFTCTIPCGLPSEEFEHTKNVIRGKDGIGEDDFVILWTGGYNTWVDIDTLFEGLVAAMKENPKIKFVSTGGEIPEQDTKTYPRFLKMVENSPYRNRFFMKGWVRGEDVPNYYFEADVGINIDKDIYEVRLGSKNRILDWMRAGLCVLSSNVCELTEIIERERIGYTFKAGDPDDLAKKLIYLASHPDEVKKTGLAGKKFGFRKFNFDKTTEVLQQWVNSPAFAPDYRKPKKIFFDREEALRNLNDIVTRQKKMIEERDSRISELEGIVKGSFIYKLYSYIKVILRKIRKKSKKKSKGVQ